MLTRAKRINPQTGGLGNYLISKLMDEVLYFPKKDDKLKSENEIRLIKFIKK